MKIFTRNLSMSLALLGGAALAPHALAERDYALAFKPAEISTKAGMQQLHNEIREVAKDACPSSRGVRSIRLVKTCIQEVTADLVSKVGVPAFSEFVENNSERRAPALIASTR